MTAGVCRLTGSHQLQGMWRKIESRQSFASAMRIYIIPLSKKQLFCSVVNGKGSLKARKNLTCAVVNLAGAKASKAPDVGEQPRYTEYSLSCPAHPSTLRANNEKKKSQCIVSEVIFRASTLQRVESASAKPGCWEDTFDQRQFGRI